MINKIYNLIKQSLQEGTYDFTTGSIKKAIALLAIPMILELGLESVFALVDIYFVGKLPNAENAIATVGLTEASLSLIYTIAIGLSIGATAIVARRIGEKNNEAASKVAAQTILLSGLIAIIISILGIWQAKNILLVMGAAESVVEQGCVFTQILMGASISIILLFVINGIFRGAGNAAIAMKSLWLASGVNILLCPVLIYGVGNWQGLGLAGAAWATAIGRTCGVLFQVYSLYKKSNLIKIKQSYFTCDTKAIKAIVQVAMPATMQFFLQSGSWIFMAYIVSSTGGTDASAGYQIAIRNIVFFILPAWGLSNAAATLVGQNLGALKPDRAEQSILLCTRYNVIFMAVVTIIFLSFSPHIISFFTTNITIVQYGTDALRHVGSGFIFYGVGMVMMQSLNGAGDTKTPTWINFICFWGIQIPLAWILANTYKLGPYGAFIAVPTSETILALCAWFYFKKGKWKTIKL